MGIIRNTIARAAVKLYQLAESGSKQDGRVNFIQSVLQGSPIWTKSNYQNNANEGYKKSLYVYRCIRERSVAVASVPLKVYEARQDNEDELLEGHPLQELLDKPNPWESGQDIKEFWELSRMLSGEAFFHLVGAAPGREPEEIFYLRPDRMEIIPDQREKISGYKYKLGSNEFNLDTEEIIFFKLIDPTNDYRGMAPIEAGSRTVDISNEIEDWNKVFFQNAARPDGAFVSDQNLNDKNYKRMKRQVNKDYVGKQKAHKPLILEGGVTWQEIGKAHKDLDFPQLKKLSREDICILFETPPPVVGIMDNSTYNNYETARRVFWENTIIPELKELCTTLNAELAPLYGDNIYIAPDLSDIEALKENENDKVERVSELVEKDIFTLNEARSEFDKEEKPWGDQTLSQLRTEAQAEMTTSSKKVEEYLKKNEVKGAEYTLEDIETWVKFVRKADGQEKKLRNLIQNIFTDQEQIILENLRKNKGKLSGREIKLEPGDILFDFDEQVETTREQTEPVYEGTIKTFGEEAVGVVGGSISFDRKTTRVREFLESKPFKMAEQITETTRKRLIDTFEEGIEAGEGIEELADRVSEEFEYARGERARKIARTENTGAANFSKLEGYRQTGVVKEKKWLSALDERTRTAHSNAHGQTVPIDENFDIGGEELEYPGDPSGSAKNIIYCRCSLVPILDE